MAKQTETTNAPAKPVGSLVEVARGGRNDEPVNFDELGRDAQLLSLVRIISRTDPPLVIGVHGDWGAGKTSFMKVLQAVLSRESRQDYHKIEVGDKLAGPHLTARAVTELNAVESKAKNADIMTVWFNPWEHQFEDEPVMPLLDAIRHQQSSRWSKLTSGLKRVVEDPKFRIIGKAALGVAKMVGPGWFSALSRQIGDEARHVLDTFSQFREEFQKCMAELTAESGGRLVIFIDDLDRCEAEYVVKILEALKLHLLNKHCIFVLGCADQRVQYCLREKMGLGEAAAREYVEKIVQLPFHLPLVWDRDFKQLLRQLGWERMVEDEQCFNLLRAFAGNNRRRLKRFLHWYQMERGTVRFVEGLDEKAGEFFKSEAMFLKIKLLQFAEPAKFRLPEDFQRDLPRAKEPDKVEGEDS